MELPSTPAGRKRFPNISALAYQHPLDLEALEAVKKIPLAASLYRKLSEVWLEKWFDVSTIGDNLRLGPNQCPRIYNLFVEAASILDMPVPEVYLDTQHQVNAFAFGMKRYTVTVYSGLIDLLEEEELLAVIGHELSHIKCEHMLYKSLTEILSKFGVEFLSRMLGVGGNLLSLPLLAALAAWSRKAELSCDRAALLVTQNPEVVARTLTKLGGSPGTRWQDQIDLDAVVKQAGDYDKLDDSILQKGMLVYMSWQRSHPYPIYRAGQILAWAKSEQYAKILSGDYVTHARAAQLRKGTFGCPKCGLTVSADQDFCPGCGFQLSQPKPQPAAPPAPVAAPAGGRTFCVGCGAELSPEWKFCMSCGQARPAAAGAA